MKQEKKEALYILAIIVCSFAAFRLGQTLDSRCAAAVEAQRQAVIDSEYKAAAAKLDFCIKNRPPLNNNKRMAGAFHLFKEMRCPERLLYAECDDVCRKELITSISLDIQNWDNYKEVDDPDDLFKLMDRENYIKEP